VHLLNVASLARRQLEATLPAVVRMTVKIAQRHAAERGVIHTHSYALTQAILAGLNDAGMGDRVIAPANAEEREAAVARHTESTNTILVSPSLFEGFDFRGELARWQLLVKCPFPSLADAQVRAKAELDPLWYKIEAFKALLQAAGRGMRSADDWCVTYALDKDISRLLADAREHAPQWFLDAVHEH
jgi:Rad3-related DNA helicase